MDGYSYHVLVKKLDKILKVLSSIQQKESEMNVAIEELKVQVAETVGVEQSVITLLGGISARLEELAAELAAAGVDNADVLKLRDDLDASEQALAAAVAAVPPPA